MTDLTPNDLSHLSDEEFNALCPQGEHAPGAEPLSPAAQAVLDAAHDGANKVLFDIGDDSPVPMCVAAALRAAADQVVPIRLIDEPDFCPSSCCERVLREERTEMRGDLLAIAAELEGH